jgi:cyclopropane fatty-acyl-phospholipid synthase-like methyltransferase
MIKEEAVKAFWEKRGEKYTEKPPASVAKLEETPELLELKINLERERIFSLLTFEPSMRVLDLGCGYGDWAFRFAPHVREVIGVEYANSMYELAEAEKRRHGAPNVRFVNCPAEEYRSSFPFDLVWVSGLFVYMTDRQAESLLKELPFLSTTGGLLLVRDGTSILEQRHILDGKFSEHLKEYYSAVYRTRDEYIGMFSSIGFVLQKDGQMFDEGSPLNKYPETRLRYYLFRKG